MRRRPSRATSDGPSVEIPGLDVIDRIGAGGFSVVYRARQRSMNRDVAVKVLNTGFSSDAERRTFERECHALGRVSHHPNIVTVFSDAVTTDGRPCIVMELYPTTYRQLVDQHGRLGLDEVLSVGVRMCGALQTAHDAGILHRDLKPHNIFVSAYGEPALGDFGISTIDDERSQSGTSGLSVAYAAPEVLEDGAASVAADVYSLAATLYQLAGGSSPYASADMKTTVRRILTEEPPPVGRDDAPPGFDRALRHALAKVPGQRPESAVAFAEMLREVQARAGFARTPIPRDASTVEPVALLDEPPPPPAAPHAPAGDRAGDDRVGDDRTGARAGTGDDPIEDDAAGMTIARPRPVAPPMDRDDVDDQPSPVRRWVAAGVAVMAVVVLALGLLTFGGGDGDTADGTTTSAAPPPTEGFFDLVAAPTGVAVAPVEEGVFEVSFEVDEGTSRVEIEIVGGPGAGRVTATPDSPAEVRADVATLCVVLRALGERGRISADTEPACSR